MTVALQAFMGKTHQFLFNSVFLNLNHVGLQCYLKPPSDALLFKHQLNHIKSLRHTVAVK